MGSKLTGAAATPLAKKLGISRQMRVAAVGAPTGYRALLEPLPAGVRIASRVDRTVELVHVFATQRSALAQALTAYRTDLDPAAVVWVSWPKRSARVPTDFTEDVVREIALPLGFVDVKVCAIDEVWSGLKLVVRKELR